MYKFKLFKIKKRQLKIIISIISLIIGLGYYFLQSKNVIEKKVVMDPESKIVTRVIDGDTIEIEGGQKVRYIGINTPETKDPRKEVECFGKEAAGENNKLVMGKRVKLEKDVSDKDKYGRLLRYVYVGELFINLELIKNGYAQIMTYPPDVKYQKDFLTAEKQAREQNLGLWSKCQ